MTDDAPASALDALDGALIAHAQLLDQIAAELGPVASLVDDAPAPLWPDQSAA